MRGGVLYETARPPGSALAETALLAGGKRPFCHARQCLCRWLFRMLCCHAPDVCSLLVAQCAETLGTAAISAPRTHDDSWISLSRGRPPELGKANHRQAGGLQWLHNGLPIPPDATGGPVLVTRLGRCHPSLLVRARQLQSWLRWPLPETAWAQLAPPSLPVTGPASGALL